MGHNLNYNFGMGRHVFFTVQQPAWHKLGKVVENALTAAEAIQEAGLDYEVRKVSNYAYIPSFGYTGDINKRDEVFTSELIKNNSSFSTVRMDTKQILGTVGATYTVVQNKDAFSFFTDIVGEKAAIFQTAGALGAGDVIFISAKLPSEIIVGKDDKIDEYLLLTNSHTGTKAIQVLFTPIRVVCNNTLNMALNNARMSVSIKHTQNVEENLKIAHKLLGIHKVSREHRELLFIRLSNTPVTDSQVRDILNHTFLDSEQLKLLAMNEGSYIGVDEISKTKSNLIQEIEQYYFTGIGQMTDTTKGTAWGVINAVSGFYQNSKKYKNEDAKFRDINLVDTSSSAKGAITRTLSSINQLVMA